MSNLDKTSKQLIDSIRKTKTGGDTAAVKSTKQKTTTEKAAKPKASATKSSSKKPKAKKRAAASKKSIAKPITSAIDQVPYPDGSRVWPD